MYVVYFLKISWVDKNWKMVKIKIQYLIDTYFIVQSGDVSNCDESEKTYLDVFSIH